MAITDSDGMVMPVAPAGGSGFGGFGGDGAWWVVLFLFAMMGGWGNGGFGGSSEFPWIMNGQNNGFSNVITNDNINSIKDAVTSLSTQFYTSQIADMERSFAAQTANTAGLRDIQGQLSQCCCDNRLATLQTQGVVQQEGAATRLAIQEQTQAILDKMCQQEIDNLKSQIVALQNQVNMQNLAASQVAQTASLIADNTAQTQYIVNRVAPYPIPSYTVPNPYGTTTTTGA